MNPRLKSLIIGNSFFIFGGSLLVPVYALFSQSVGAGIQMTGILFAAKFIANAVADLIVMRMHDGFNQAVLTYRASMAVRALAWIYVGVDPSFTSLLLTQIITGLAEGFGTPAFTMIMAKSLDHGKHMKQWAAWDLIKNPLIAAAGVAAGFVVNHWGFAAMFYLMGSLAMIGALVPVSGAKMKRSKRAILKNSYRELFARGNA